MIKIHDPAAFVKNVFLAENEKNPPLRCMKKTQSLRKRFFRYYAKNISQSARVICNNLKKIADIDHIEQFMGFGLYDRQFIEVLSRLDDPMPYLRGMVAELGGRRAEIEYEQDVRKKGKTHFNFWGMYDLAMLGITSYSKILLRISTLIGVVVGILSIVVAFVTFILKVFKIIEYPIGIAAISVAIFFFGATILFFLGIIGEYILNINIRVMNRPLVIEDERINF